MYFALQISTMWFTRSMFACTPRQRLWNRVRTARSRSLHIKIEYKSREIFSDFFFFLYNTLDWPCSHRRNVKEQARYITINNGKNKFGRNRTQAYNVGVQVIYSESSYIDPAPSIMTHLAAECRWSILKWSKISNSAIMTHLAVDCCYSIPYPINKIRICDYDPPGSGVLLNCSGRLRLTWLWSAADLFRNG